MSKQCYVCGHIIEDGEFHYCVGPNSYVCGDPHCYESWYWDNLAARFVCDAYHEYVVYCGALYQIGNENDEPRGMNGAHFTIEFFDGKKFDTNSLWRLAEIPENRRHIFEENAIIYGERQSNLDNWN